MEADLPPDPVQTVQKDARRTGRMSCCILERLRLDTEGNAATWFFFPNVMAFLRGFCTYLSPNHDREESVAPPPSGIASDKAPKEGMMRKGQYHCNTLLFTLISRSWTEVSVEIGEIS